MNKYLQYAFNNWFFKSLLETSKYSLWNSLNYMFPMYNTMLIGVIVYGGTDLLKEDNC